MTKYRAKDKLKQVVESSNYLGSGEVFNDDLRVKIYGFRKYDNEGKVDWSIREVVHDSLDLRFGREIEIKPGYRQIILSGDLIVSESAYGYNYTFTDVDILQYRPVIKCKEKLKTQFTKVLSIGFPNKKVHTETGILVDDSESSLLHEFSTNDIKITTARDNGTAMHLTRDSSTHNYLLGVNWSAYHHKSSTKKLHSVSHEVAHTVNPHHREAFYLSHAEIVKTIADNKKNREEIEELFDGHINWNKLKTLTLKGVHDQPKEIDTTGFESRREACTAVIKQMEDILGYDYKVGKTGL